MSCLSGCGRDTKGDAPFCPGCSAAVAWRSTGRTDIKMPDPLPEREVVVVATEDSPDPASSKRRKKAK